MTKVGADDLIRAGATAEDLNNLPREELRPRLAIEALHGLPGRIVEAVDPFTEADRVGTLANLLAAAGNVIGMRPHATVQHDQHPLRLYVALVGRTSKGRKGTSWSIPRHLLEQVDSAWVRERVKSGLSSGEGLIYNVRDRVERARLDKKTQQVIHEVVDEGEPDKRLLIVEPELAGVLKAVAREGNTLSAIMRQGWDTGNLQTLTKNSPLRAVGAHISIIGHITEEELRQNLTETERANGFANRFLWLVVERSKVLPEGASPPDALLRPLVGELAEVVKFASQVDRIQRDEAARAIWAEVYPELSEGKPGLFGAIISRAEAQVLRLSALYAVFDLSTFIGPTHLHAALALWDYAEASARRIFEDRLGSAPADAILEALRSRGPMTQTEISGLFQRNRSAADIQVALNRLLRLGRVRRRQEGTAGRPAAIWEASA